MSLEEQKQFYNSGYKDGRDNAIMMADRELKRLRRILKDIVELSDIAFKSGLSLTQATDIISDLAKRGVEYGLVGGEGVYVYGDRDEKDQHHANGCCRSRQGPVEGGTDSQERCRRVQEVERGCYQEP